MISCSFCSVFGEPGCYTPHPGIEAEGSCSLGCGFLFSALIGLGPVLASACCGLGASAFCHPCPSATPPLLLSHPMGWWTFLWVPLEAKLRSSGLPYPHVWKILFSLEFCLKAKDSPCTDSYFYFFIFLPQLQGSLSSSPNLRSWYPCALVPFRECHPRSHLHIFSDRVREVSTFKRKNYLTLQSISLPHL